MQKKSIRMDDSCGHGSQGDDGAFHTIKFFLQGSTLHGLDRPGPRDWMGRKRRRWAPGCARCPPRGRRMAGDCGWTEMVLPAPGSDRWPLRLVLLRTDSEALSVRMATGPTRICTL
ncbi:hypothetical protein FA13DRAFT_1014153 [Coprinellus micaceus]|uniref:Uncharacterized protein n=1 Tax=Coprinellus micaceus TaxID=71717 RepID=A0A4Y7RPN9_COPMI|nr:hypothetical protein FA13DRAFT_1014153 [Coprinellus micaceus]